MRSPRECASATALAIATFCGPPELAAQQSLTELAKASQYPISSLANLPFQFNFINGGDLGDRSLYVLNVQPTIPFRLTPKYNLVFRPIVPIVNVPIPFDGRSKGVGDIQGMVFLAPSRGHFIWGIGLFMSFPTATADILRTGSWALGPSIVLSLQSGHWVIGTLAANVWTIADDGDDRETNALLVQPFINYNFGDGWAISSVPLITANWELEDDEWTVPVGAGLARTTRLMQLPLTLTAQYYRIVERTLGGGSNQLRLQITLLFPDPPPTESANGPAK